MQTAVPFLNILDPGFRVDSAEVDRAREASWCAQTPLGIAVLRHREAVAMLKDPRFRQGAAAQLALRGVRDGPIHDWWRNVVLNTDGTQHARLRRLVAKAFTPPAVAALRPYMRATAEDLVDRFHDDGACEFVRAFAEPYPLAIICELLGIPASRRAAFCGWAADLGYLFSPNVAELRPRIESALAALHACADDLIAARRRAPGDDLVSTLVHAEEAGERLTTEELRAMIVALVFAGNDTTRNQLGLALALMARRPDLWTRLATEPRIIATAVDEIVRVAGAAPSISRIATEDVEIEGVCVPKGTYVLVMLASANRDAEVFGERAIDVERELPAPHLTFGSGMHRCLGIWLARAELEEALPILARRMPGVELASTPTWKPGLGLFGPVTLPLRFSS